MSTIFKLPDLGEGLPDAEVHEWHVKVGDVVKVDQLLVSMETAKAVVDVPSPCDGTIIKLYGNPGDTINTGSPLIEFETISTENTATQQPTTSPLIKTAPPELEPQAPQSAATVAGSIEVGDTVIHEAAQGIEVTGDTLAQIKTLPAVRLIAQKLGLNLAKLNATGQYGEITIDDLCAAIKQQITISATESTSLSASMKPLKGARKAMAAAMAQAHAAVVPVTLSDIADLSAWIPGTDFTARLIRAICVACKIEPIMNAHFDGQHTAIDIKSEVNLGLAVDSADGLFVPVIKNAEQLDALALRDTVNRFKDQIKNRTIPQDDFKGATITLSNFGVFAGYFANPVVVPPMVTIIGAGRGRDEVVAIEGKMEIHRILPLSVTFDHRAATGGEASRFLKAMIDDLALM
ncbi:MAG: 2-oxo acid dehydrogenase subunit E2 [Gammaproteobacteria bacterium]|nr:2-oxo acid dehydrogenase subunit E2 [Gammaproteobacteria bacterium]